MVTGDPLLLLQEAWCPGGLATAPCQADPVEFWSFGGQGLALSVLSDSATATQRHDGDPKILQESGFCPQQYYQSDGSQNRYPPASQTHVHSPCRSSESCCAHPSEGGGRARVGGKGRSLPGRPGGMGIAGGGLVARSLSPRPEGSLGPPAGQGLLHVS